MSKKKTKKKNSPPQLVEDSDLSGAEEDQTNTPAPPGLDDKRNEEWKCQVCLETFSDEGSQVLVCESCDDKYCRICVNIKATDYKFLTLREDIHWFCSKCNDAVVETWEKKQNPETPLNKVLHELQEMKAKMAEMEQNSKKTSACVDHGGLSTGKVSRHRNGPA